MPLLALALAHPAFADDRYLPWTYAAQTEGKNAVELEHYLTLETPTSAGTPRASWEHQVELEYGLTKRLEAGIYMVADQSDGGPLTFAGYKARLRYRLSEVDAPVATCAYLEYVGSSDLDHHELEGKFIVSGAAGRVHGALNATVEGHFGAAQAVIYEPTAGLMVAATPRAWFGAEGKVEGGYVDGAMESPRAWLGPAVHLVAREGDDDGDEAGEVGKPGLAWTFGAMVGLTGESRTDAFVEVRSLIALEL